MITEEREKELLLKVKDGDIVLPEIKSQDEARAVMAQILAIMKVTSQHIASSGVMPCQHANCVFISILEGGMNYIESQPEDNHYAPLH